MREISSIEIRYIRYFVAVADALSFRGAAEVLHVSNPTLSVQIKKLEDLLGVQLLERDTTHVRLTELGEVFLRDCRKLLQNLEHMVSALREARDGEPGHLRVGIPLHFAHSCILRALSVQRQRYPEIEVAVVVLRADVEGAAALREGRIDVGFAFNGERAVAAGTSRLTVLDAQLRALMGAGHPLASRREVTLEELAAYPVLSMGEYEHHGRDVSAVFRRRRLHPKIKTMETEESCMAMLAAEENVSLVPDLLYATHHPELALVPIRDEVPEMRMHLHADWNKNESSPQARNFIEVLRELREGRG